MKIYKLDIDTSKPIRKVVQMQQNSTGALSVDVSNDGKYIRNLSCALYDGDTELSSYATTDVGAGYKIDMGNETKVVKFTAKSVPTECSASVIKTVGTGTPMKHLWASRFQLGQGTYNQDEFASVVSQFANDDGGLGMIVWIVKDNAGYSLTNLDRIAYVPKNPSKQLWFYNANGIMNDDELISVYTSCDIGRTVTVKKTGSLSSFTYPAVGYWTDYSLDTVIRPSENAHCYAEQEVSDPTPDPEPEPEPTPEQGE